MKNIGKVAPSALSFEQMREQIYSEVATLITQNESRPFYLLNLFKELQLVRDKNSRDQCLKSIFKLSKHRSTSNDNNNNNNKCQKDDHNNGSKYVSRNLEDLTTTTITTTIANDDTANEDDTLEQNYLNGRQSASSNTQFDSDSLSNTVIFVKKNIGVNTSSSSGVGTTGLIGANNKITVACNTDDDVFSKLTVDAKSSSSMVMSSDGTGGNIGNNYIVLFI